MALYLVMQFEAGKLNYNQIMVKKLFKPLKEDVDAMLAADGYVINEEGWAVKVEKM